MISKKERQELKQCADQNEMDSWCKRVSNAYDITELSLERFAKKRVKFEWTCEEGEIIFQGMSARFWIQKYGLL